MRNLKPVMGHGAAHYPDTRKSLPYALTHSPEPLTEEYIHTLSCNAATERLEAAGCITLEEAEVKDSLSAETGVEITLPSLIEDEDERNAVKKTLLRSRDRYLEEKRANTGFISGCTFVALAMSFSKFVLFMKPVEKLGIKVRLGDVSFREAGDNGPARCWI